MAFVSDLPPLHLVWYKRDLRLRDHAPLLAAARHAPVVGLYVYEPEVYSGPEFDAAHLEFVNQSLLALEADLAALGGRLVYRVGRLPEVFDQLHRDYGVAGVYAHEETGNAVSFARDRRVRRWAAARGVPFHEFQSGAVLRGRTGAGVRSEAWRERWYRSVHAPVLDTPKRLVSAPVPAERHRTPWELGLSPTRKALPLAGEAAAQEVLTSFLAGRGLSCARDISSPARLGQLVAPEPVSGVGQPLEPPGVRGERAQTTPRAGASGGCPARRGVGALARYL